MVSQEDIIRMAREADGILLSDSEIFGLGFEFEIYQLQRFAALVAAAENEACACLCDALERTKVYGPKECAEGIRARATK